jgi:DNA-directed RNA polymerase specialized sigma24 family protein
MAPGKRITGEARTIMAGEVLRAYAEGKPIRQIAQEQDRSYGAVHRMLTDAGVELRKRGGSNGGRRKRATPPK